MKVFTIGFTRKSAAEFFLKLEESGASRVVDVRLNNVSQLAGFAKREDLKYFLQKICRMEYVHAPELAPTREMLDSYRKKSRDWIVYQETFLDLMRQRAVETTVPRQLIMNCCLLCSEDKPDRCHRRLVVEYLKEHWGDIEVRHLV
jgi:uncharacterized protein (DUF488 family)